MRGTNSEANIGVYVDVTASRGLSTTDNAGVRGGGSGSRKTPNAHPVRSLCPLPSHACLLTAARQTPRDGARGVLERFLLSAHVSSWLMFSCRESCFLCACHPRPALTTSSLASAFSALSRRAPRTQQADGARCSWAGDEPALQTPTSHQGLTARVRKTPTFQQRGGGGRAYLPETLFLLASLLTTFIDETGECKRAECGRPERLALGWGLSHCILQNETKFCKTR